MALEDDITMYKVLNKGTQLLLKDQIEINKKLNLDFDKLEEEWKSTIEKANEIIKQLQDELKNKEGSKQAKTPKLVFFRKWLHEF